MSITPSDDGLAADLTCEQSFGCPIILTCTVYDEMDNSVSADIRLDYDSVLGSLGTLEDWAEVESEREIEDALETSCNIRLARDIECSVEIEHRTHLDLNGHTLSGEADVSKRARIENGKMTSSEDGIIAEGDEKIEIKGVDIEAGKTGVIANSNVEISNCSVTGTSAYGIYASGGSVVATVCEIKSGASDTDTHAAVYSASSASVTVSGGSVEGGVGAWAYTGNVTLEDVFVTSTAGDGLKAYQGTVKATGATVESADSGAYCTNSGTVTLTSCTVTGTTYATYQSGGTLTASGGTLSGPNGCYCSGGTTNLKDSCFVTATNSSSGSAVYAAGGTINATGCTLAGYYGVRQSSGSIDIERCSVTGSSYGIYISGQDTEPVIEYDDFVDCSGYAVYNSSSSRTVEAYWCYTDGKENDTGYRDLGHKSLNVYCTPCYVDSMSLSLSFENSDTIDTIYTGGETTATLTAKTEISDGMSGVDSYGWVSESASVATVSSRSTTANNITVTAKGVGIVSITCTATTSGGAYSENIDVNVEHQIKSVSVSLSLSSSKTFYAGRTATTTTMTAEAGLSYNSGTSYSGEYKWSSSNTNVATVSWSDSTATITAIGAGTATITCTVDTDVSGTSGSFTVTAQAVTGLSLSRSNSTIYYGSTATTTSSTITATPTMNDGTFNGSYSWSVTSGSSYVSYSSSTSSSFTVTSKAGGGTATVQCTTSFNNSSYSSTTTITVTAQAISSISLTASNSTIYYNGNTKTSTVTAKVSMNNGTYSGSYSGSTTSGGSYVSRSSSTSSTCTITANGARGTATIQCSATFNGTTKTASVSILVEYRYQHTLSFFYSGIASGNLSDVWLQATFCYSTNATISSFDDLVKALSAVYGTGSSNSFDILVSVWDTKGYNLTSGYISGSNIIATDGTVTATLTSTYVKINGSSYTNGTFYGTPTVLAADKTTNM